MIEMDKLTERLKGPDMVASFQKYFGIRAIFCDDQGMINNVISKESGVNVHHHHHTKSSSSNKKVVYSQSNGHVTEDKEVYKRKRVHKEDDNRSIMDENNCYYTAECSQNGHTVKYEITNKFWYWLFAFGASLGYEIFYATFFPFWFWNIDGAVGRQMILLWALVMYVGQSLKDVIRWPRPSSPPVVVMEPEYAIEYGMPSTHAMVGSVLPFSMVIFTMHRYDYPAWIGFVFATLWCALVCGSRLYLGMHSVLDILAGLVLSAIMMLLLLPIIEALDTFLLINKYSPFLSIPLVIAMATFYPKSDHWSPARGDTCVIIGAGSGILFGSWLNYQLGIIRGPSLPRPFPIMWPGFNLIGLALLRACIGILCIVGVRALGKFATFSLVCYIHKLNPKDPETRIKPYVEIPVKLLTYFFMGISITYLAPKVFRLLYIERPTMFTEV